MSKSKAASKISSPLARAFLTPLLIMLVATGCTKGCGQDSNPPESLSPNVPGVKTPKVGTTVFQFDYESVTELMIVKADPLTGDSWTARLQRPNLKSTDWEIKSGSAGDDRFSPLDRKADGNFILHLLDTLRTLQVLEVSVQGPHPSLGLAPPRFALMWKSNGKEFELRIGSPARLSGVAPGTPKAAANAPANASYAWVPGHAAFILGGAALQMLDYTKSFSSLRLKNWAGLNSDDIDELEFFQAGKATYFAQREGSDWKDRAHHGLKEDVTATLEGLTHARAARFIDDPKAAAEARTQIRKSPLREVALTNRHGQVVRMQIGKAGRGQQLFGLSSARPEGVFEIYPETLRFFEPPRK